MVMSSTRICVTVKVRLQRNKLLPGVRALQHLQPLPSSNMYYYKQINVLSIKFHPRSIKCARGAVVGF